jgi:succinyl-CoA synthetase beta subunit
MNLHEYQAKQLLANSAVAVPPGGMADSVAAAGVIAAKLLAGGARLLVVKAQVHAGGRGQGIFKNGLRGGVQVCSNVAEVCQRAGAMLGQVLVTRQTGPGGRLVSKVLVEAASAIKRELYLAVLLDRASAWPLVIASTEGGMDIEEVAARSPAKLIKESVDPALGLMAFQARRLAVALGLSGELLGAAAELFQGVYRTWWECDASLVEINPLGVVEGAQGKESLLALDAKMALDDNALWRHQDLRQMRDLAEEEPLEIEAGRHNLSYIRLDGNIACLVNGAGLAMATMDIIKACGGKPANFLDIGGGAGVEQVTAAFKIILRDPNVQAILVNIFGGIVQCDLIASGIVAAASQCRLFLPLVVRLEGNRVELGRQFLLASGLPIISADSMADAAQKVVKAALG